jgi:hypothetical protein
VSEDQPEPSTAEQYGFAEAHDVICDLVDEEGMSASDVCQGVFQAALSRLKQEMPEAAIAALLYQLADDYATRRRDDG